MDAKPVNLNLKAADSRALIKREDIDGFDGKGLGVVEVLGDGRAHNKVDNADVYRDATQRHRADHRLVAVHEAEDGV